jgi:hypothetical protein
MSTGALVSTAFRTVATAVRGEHVVGMLLSTIPLAERMLLYQVAMTAWAMVPERSVVRRNPKATGVCWKCCELTSATDFPGDDCGADAGSGVYAGGIYRVHGAVSPTATA